jgi:hypothetical protein
MLQTMIKWLGIIFGTLFSACCTRRSLALENLALRQQLALLKHRNPRPRLTDSDRLFWLVLSKTWNGWRSALHVVNPATVVRWHRQGFRYYWRWKSRRRGRPGVDAELRAMIRNMSRANPLWGAPRIHGELLKLGIEVSQATVSKYMLRSGKPPVAELAYISEKPRWRDHRAGFSDSANGHFSCSLCFSGAQS